jgi:hypothetical protein
MPSAPRARLSALALALAGCGVDFPLPPRVAGSEYIDYHTDVDASVICMDDLLAREDRFIERTAGLLGVDPPSGTIDYVWEPAADGTKPWECPDMRAEDCYQHSEDGISVVVSDSLSQHHELVHAIEHRAMRPDGHNTLEEGLAEYLGTLNVSTFTTDKFPDEFKEMLAASPMPGDYRLAMHFVGSIFARHGVEKFRALYMKMPTDAGLDEFAAVFEAVYGQTLDAALIEMSGVPLRAIDTFVGCDDGEAPALAWADDALLDVTIESACGDPLFYGGGFTDGQAGFYGRYLVEVPRAGYYDLKVDAAPGGPMPLRGLLTGCSFEMIASAAISRRGASDRALLQPGRHSLIVAFPPASEARGTATVQLTFFAPP